MSDLLYNWAVHSASKVLLLSLGDIAGELTPGMLWLLFALMLVLAVTASALLIRLMRARKEITRLLLQFDQVATTQPTTEQQAGHTIGAGEQTTRLDPQGYFDPLTQLPNRKVIESAITAELQHCSTENRSALLILGLTNLSRVNETYGRAMGDLFLQHVTHRLRRLMGKEDILARLNSNRFAILMKGLPQPASSASIFMRNHTQNIQKSLESPYLIGGIALQGQISIGVAYIENPTYSAQKIIQHALIALRQTHNYPGLRVECFNDRLSSLLKESQQLVTDLPQAIEKGQMKIHVHPQHSLNGELIGVELLMRWQHPTLGNISPTRFIPLAEKENLIHSLGLWALEQAREFIRQNDYPGLNVSINVSPLQFHSIYFPEFIDLLVSQRAEMGQRLIIELTEGTFMENVKEANRIMRFLNQLGYRFSLDDFGTGYSNLAAISSFPLYGLKLDRSLVTGIAQDAELRTIAKMVATLANSLQLHSIAEGVEQEEDLETLKELGFDAVQGFHFSKPMSLQEWPEFLAQTHLGQTPQRS